MTHEECKNFISLDCEKGQCAVCKAFVPIDGEGSQACPNFVEAERCGNCEYFSDADKYGVGKCVGYEKENWAYASCGAFSCQKYKHKG